jgi:iron complex transport system substrate-binding protein
MGNFPRAAAALLVFVLVACGGDPSSDSADTTVPIPSVTGPDAASTTAVTTADTPVDTVAADEGFPVSVAADNGEVTIASRPEAIVSLSPTHTEMLFAMGAGEQVVAVDDQSDYPAEAPVTDLSGFTPNVEAIAGYEPDVVVISTNVEGLVDELGALDIPVLYLDAPPTVAGAFDQMEMLGVATGNVAGAAELVATTSGEIDAVLAELPDTSGLMYFHELDPTLYTVTSGTFIGDLYAMLGLENIADAAAEDGLLYPQLTAEYVLDVDPDLVFLADAECCGESASSVAARPGWSQMTAVTTGGVVELDEDISSRWGPRMTDHVAAVAEAIEAVMASSTP